MERARGAERDRTRTETWVREDRTEEPTPAKAAPPAATRGGGRRRKRLPPEIGAELSEAVGTSRATRLAGRLAEATRAYEADRYRDAVRIVKPLAEAAPGAAAVRELYGLARYRLGHWNEAIRELEAFRSLTGSFDQHPTLADCYRAKKRWRQVDELWEELRAASPNPEVVAEGRIVVAGALADRGRVAEAIDVLERAKTDLRRPRAHHLRLWYALGDLYERAGELTRAREFFRRVLEFDPDLYDTAERLAAIR
ncbi:MAG: tetratricopeptide repeat protein [Actinobacteria bacterium]|nr:tetratricopeptide repeat protein [Actinomycetota bacterium]